MSIFVCAQLTTLSFSFVWNVQVGNKGACAVSWAFGAATGMATRFLAICCHLEAHTHKVSRRHANARHILSALHLQPPASPRGLTQTVFSSFFPSLTSPLRGRSRSRALSPRTFGDARRAAGSPLSGDVGAFDESPGPGSSGAFDADSVRAHRHGRGQSMPSHSMPIAERHTNDASGRMSPLRSSIESSGSLPQGHSRAGSAVLQSKALVRRSMSMPGGVAALPDADAAPPRSAFRVRQRPPVYIESLQHWDPDWARAGRGSEATCSHGAAASVDWTLRAERQQMWEGFVGGLGERQGSMSERPRGMSTKELTPVSEGQEASSSTGGAASSGSADACTQSQLRSAAGRPRTPQMMATAAAAAVSDSLGQLDSLNAWNSPMDAAARVCVRWAAKQRARERDALAGCQCVDGVVRLCEGWPSWRLRPPGGTYAAASGPSLARWQRHAQRR